MSGYDQTATAVGEKLTKWKKEPSLLELKCDVEAAKGAHDLQVGKIKHWNDLLQVKGAAKPKQIKGRSGVQPKLIRRQAEWRYSALTEPFLGTEQLFKVSPSTYEDGEAARQNELVLNWQFRTKLNKVKFVDDYVRANVDEGTVIVRTGWCRQTVMTEQKVPAYDHMLIQDPNGPDMQVFKAAVELKMSDEEAYAEQVDPLVQAAVDYFEESQQATVAVDNGKTTKLEVETVLVNQPTVEVMNPQNVRIDPACGGDIDKAGWVLVSFETNKAELLKEGKKYLKAQIEKVNWEGNTPLNTPDHETTTPQEYQSKNALTKKVVAHELWTFWDINNDGILVPIVVTYIGDIIIRMDVNPFPDQKLPFVVVPYLPVKRELYGEPDAELLEDNQKILGAVMRGTIDLLGRSANGQQGFAKGMLDPLNKRRYENGQDYEFNPNSNPQMGLIEHKYPELPQSAMLMLGMQNQEAEALTGVKSFGGGLSGEAYGDVAAGIRGVLDAASKREMAILRRLAQGMKQIGDKIIAMNAVFLSEEEVVRVTNSQFVTIKREDLAGNFDLIVDISTAEVDAAQAEKLAFMLQTMGPNMDFGMTQLILAEIAKLHRMPELRQKILEFQPQPDPLAVKKAELEIVKLEAEIAKLQTDAGLNQARTTKTEAEAMAVDVDTAETQDGTKHGRELEKLQGQAEGNKELEVTKALLKTKKPDEKGGDVEAAIGFNALTGANKIGGGTAPPLQ